MNKKYSIILALSITLLIADLFFISSFQSENNNKETVILARVIDGDTFVTSDGRSVRLLNINAPEKGTPNAELSKNFLKIYENKSIEIEITGRDKYQRELARIFTPNYANLDLVNLGLSSKFMVDKSELKLFSKAEDNAIKSALGIWAHSEYFGCFNSKIFEKDEIVVLENKCGSIDVSNWFLKDESRKTYIFKTPSISKVTLHSGIGIDNSTDLFWQSKTDIWNNDRDTLYLFDKTGGLVGYESYGY